MGRATRVVVLDSLGDSVLNPDIYDAHSIRFGETCSRNMANSEAVRSARSRSQKAKSNLVSAMLRNPTIANGLQTHCALRVVNLPSFSRNMPLLVAGAAD